MTWQQTIQQIVKLYPGAVPEGACVPFAYYGEDSVAVLTTDGIAGTEGTLTLTVVAKTKDAADNLADKVVATLNGNTFDNTDFYIASRDYIAYPEQGVAGIELIFNTLTT